MRGACLAHLVGVKRLPPVVFRGCSRVAGGWMGGCRVFVRRALFFQPSGGLCHADMRSAVKEERRARPRARTERL